MHLDSSFARSARRWLSFAALTAMATLPVTLVFLALLNGPPFAAELWLQEPLVGTVYAATGLPALVQMCLLPLLVGAAAVTALAGFDTLVRVSGLDSTNKAWISFRWALRTWRSWLACMALLVAAGIAVALALAGYDALRGDDADSWAGVFLVMLVTPYAMLAFAMDSRNLATESPPSRWSARWPPTLALVVLVALIATVILGSRLHSELQVHGLGWPGAIAFWLVSLALELAFLLTWLARPQPRDFLGLMRHAFQPRVMAVVLVQWLRLTLWVVLGMLPILALGWFLVGFVPVAAPALRESSLLPEGGILWLVHASRFVVAWWWLLLVAFSVLLAPVLAWFPLVAWARLMVELGVVAPTPATHPDCDPAATTPPTA